ncbi:MAG: TMEM165/GDT1 family protein [Sphingorhabdus sp.]
MDGFLITMIAVFLAETGDRTQLLSAALAQRFGNERDVFIGLLAATLLNSFIAVLAGSLVDGWISEDALRLFTSLAYIFAGGGMLLWQRKIDLLEKWKMGPLWTSFFGILILQFGDKGQFLIAANAANWDAWGLVFAGGVAGILAASGLAMILRERLAKILPMQAIRMTAGACLLLIGLYLALMALRLI